MAYTPTPSPAFTPGPWTFKETDEGNHRIIGMECPHPEIAAVFSQGTKAERDANARLIAAAPELLERCKRCLADAEAILADPSEVSDEVWQSIVDDLREVITAVEGKEE